MAAESTSANAAADQEANARLRQQLAEVRHVLAKKLETVAVVSKQLAEVCDQVEAMLNLQVDPSIVPEPAAKLPATPDTESLDRDQRQLLLATMSALAKRLNELKSAPDWWQQVATQLSEETHASEGQPSAQE